MTYTLGGAAEAVGKSKATLSKAVKAGKISVTKNEDGSFSIEPSELHRVYPPVSQTTVVEHSETATVTPEKDIEIATLKAQLAAAKDKIDDLKQLADEIRSDRDAWKTQAARLLAAPITAQKSDDKKTFWIRFMRR